MNLTQKIIEKKMEFQSAAPTEVQTVMGDAIKNLQESGILDRALAKGDTVQDFTLDDTRNNSVNLINTLSAGPVVLGFYRGGW